MQIKMINLGYDLGPDGADGSYGPDTEKAVKQYYYAPKYVRISKVKAELG